MAGRHIKALIAAYHDRDDLAFRRATQGIIEEEEAKRHTALAQDLRRLLAAGAHSAFAVEPMMLPESPRDRDSNVPIADVAPPPTTGLRSLLLNEQTDRTLSQVIAEVPMWQQLDAAGLPRRNRLLLYGPPGCGKTSIASAVAGELGWPLTTARVDSLVSSYLGETASNLRNLFDFAQQHAHVVFLDEFDSLGKLRNDPSDHGELRRVVNAVLQLIDSYQGRSIVIAATNNPEILDSALWRRFDEVLEVPAPTVAQIAALLHRQLSAVNTIEIERFASRLAGLSFAAVRHAADGARRRALLDGRREATIGDLDEAVRDTVSRPWA
ncbi:MAG: hypothetical protein BGO37_12960 [Cellulomonas sp. 73-92]|uniref:AAA family ATPase n=1 Tax=Cellulomonas sp. 73-92 TaxID=1895740 RepID=UPI00092A3DDC|nr:AAA family ATPase [Cellulomonas sp. 73-92]OJV79329.1 MAG: hypothetical protein BGO37_12960 [Cellulomonas sp. 73-92]